MELFNKLKDAFEEGWEEEFSNLPDETKETIRKMKPFEIVLATFIVLLTPLVWFEIMGAMVKGGIKGFRRGLGKR